MTSKDVLVFSGGMHQIVMFKKTMILRVLILVPRASKTFKE